MFQYVSAFFEIYGRPYRAKKSASTPLLPKKRTYLEIYTNYTPSHRSKREHLATFLVKVSQHIFISMIFLISHCKFQVKFVDVHIDFDVIYSEPREINL